MIGTAAALQERLRQHAGRAMDPGLADVQARLNAEFRRRNAAARDEKWNRLETDEERAEADQKRFLRERFSTTAGDEAVVVKTDARFELHQAAKHLGLDTLSTDAPLEADGRRPRIDKWIVIARTRSAVFTKIREINQEASRTQQRAKEKRDSRNRKLQQDLVDKEKKSAGPRGDWDVTGKWAISCPSIEQERGDEGRHDECSLHVHRTERKGRVQMWAEFNFMVITGGLPIRTTTLLCERSSSLSQASF